MLKLKTKYLPTEQISEYLGPILSKSCISFKIYNLKFTD